MKLFKHQHWHLLTLLILLTGIYCYVRQDSSLLLGELWGISTSTWFYLAILSPILHQLYVLVGWLPVNKLFAYLIAGILFIPTVYLFYSVKKYFGMDRAFGIDHFYPAAAKKEPFVKKGIFQYTDNGMYIFGFFILWIPSLLLLSKAALLVALFNHVYIWVHYYFTELPDIKVIYED